MGRGDGSIPGCPGVVPGHSAVTNRLVPEGQEGEEGFSVCLKSPISQFTIHLQQGQAGKGVVKQRGN